MNKTASILGGIIVYGGLAVVVVGLLGGIFFGIPAFGRYQKRAAASNEVQINSIRILQQEQLIQVEQQQAQIRVEEARGIAESQDIINTSLTDQYLQYLAIQAQREMAKSPNHTQIYVPSGANGIPLIRTISE